jgi:UDP-N-acetylglucosamine--N-acetylmuramyl-(pentapeptide) pyrophosphoryl-undecaprenol N-acetylglucosamine transferase
VKELTHGSAPERGIRGLAADVSDTLKKRKEPSYALLRYSYSEIGPSVRKADHLKPESSTHNIRSPLKVVIAGGGTGGHISPAIAVAHELRRRGPVELYWIGSHSGFERDAAREDHIPFFAVRTGKLRRYLARETLVDAFRVPIGVIEARRVLKAIRPDVIFSTGGFVSTPTVIAGRTLGISSITHEQTATMGLATRINARFSDVVALSFAGDNSVHARRRARIVVTGNPVRSGLLGGNADTLSSLYDLQTDEPLVYVTGGAQGAHALNETIAGALPDILEHVVVIHQCGPQLGNGDYQQLMDRRESLDQNLQRRYLPVERVGDELAHIYAAATLVIGRAGAGTVAELAKLGKASILVPLPGASEQLRNAMVLAEVGAALIVDQEDLDPDLLIALVKELVEDTSRLSSMADAALTVAPDDPAIALADEIYKLAAPRLYQLPVDSEADVNCLGE